MGLMSERWGSGGDYMHINGYKFGDDLAEDKNSR